MVNEHTWQLIVIILGSTGFWATIQVILQNFLTKKNDREREAKENKLQKELVAQVEKRQDVQDKEDEKIRAGVVALLHDAIYEKCQDAIAKGKISVNDFDNLNHLYQPYRKLGGNGTCKKLMTHVLSLPTATGIDTDEVATETLREQRQHEIEGGGSHD